MKSAKSVPSKTLNRRERRGTQRKHILGFSAVGAATYKTSAYLCALCGKKSFKACYVSFMFRQLWWETSLKLPGQV